MENILKGLNAKAQENIEQILRAAYHEGYSAGLEFGRASSSTVEGTGEVELPKTEKRVAQIGEFILIKNENLAQGKYKNGDVLEVTEVRCSGVSAKGVSDIGILHEEYEVVFETGSVEPIPAPLTANQQRAELIQRAREFVEEHQRDLPGEWNCRDYGNPTCRRKYYETEFSIKENKVTAVIYAVNYHRERLNSKPRHVGRAKCMPGDVFNADIGKAIALAKALEIDIPQEFLDAVQPDEIVVGMIAGPKEEEVAYFSDSGKVPLKVTRVDDYGDVHRSNGKNSDKEDFKIIDDTNAIYPV